MKKMKTYMWLLLTLVMGVAMNSCHDDNNDDISASLSVKVFAPTRVMPGQKVVITGSGFGDVKSVNFGSVETTNIRMVSPNDIEVITPAGVPAEGGELTVNTSNEKVTARQRFTVGVPQPRSYDPADTVNVGSLLKIVGSDLQFIEKVLFTDKDENDIVVEALDFVRKAESFIQVNIPNETAEGEGKVRLIAVDGSSISVPAPIVFKKGGGHIEFVKTTIWKGDGSAGPVSWNGTYRFSNTERSTGEEIYAIPMDIWELMKTTTFYLDLEATDPQIRVTTGWWSTTWTGLDYQPGTSDLLTDNGDGTWTMEINLSGDPILDAMDVEHLLFTGDRYTPLEIYFAGEVWVDDGGESSPEEVVIWEGDGSAGGVSWNSVYRFSNAERSTGEEIYAIPMDQWEIIKTNTFYLDLEATDPQIRVTTGWWSTTWTGADFQPGTSELLTDHGDGTWTLEINLSGDPILDAMDVEHLLFTGDRYTPRKLYYYFE